MQHKSGSLVPLGASQPSKNTFWAPGPFQLSKTACLALGPFQPSENSIFLFLGRFRQQETSFLSWAVSTSNKQHFGRLGRFNHQKSACLRLGPFQPSRNSIVGPWDRFNHPKTAFGALGAFQLPKTAHLRTTSLKGIRPAFRLHSVAKLTFPNTAKSTSTVNFCKRTAFRLNFVFIATGE